MPSTITPDNLSPVVSIITWFLFCVIFMCVAARIATKWTVVRKFDLDDIVIFFSLVFGTGNSIAVSVAASKGLGKHFNTLTASDAESFQKALYAADLLFIVTLTTTKVAVTLLLKALTPIKLHQKYAMAVGIISALWGITSFLVTAFECQAPSVWKVVGNNCISLNAFDNYLQITNILTDLLLIILPVVVLWDVKISARRKVAIVGCFVARGLVVAAVIVQLVIWNSSNRLEDLSFDLWEPTVVTQIVVMLSIVTACIPYLKPLYLSFETGMLRSDDLLRNGVGIYGQGTVGYFKDSSGKNTRAKATMISTNAEPQELKLD